MEHHPATSINLAEEYLAAGKLALSLELTNPAISMAIHSAIHAKDAIFLSLKKKDCQASIPRSGHKRFEVSWHSGRSIFESAQPTACEQGGGRVRSARFADSGCYFLNPRR